VLLAVTVLGRRIAGRERAVLSARPSPGLVHLAVGAMVRNITVLVLPVVFLIRLSSDRAFLGSLASSRPRARLRVVGGRLLLGRFGLIG
jgi:hypothetical protein